MAKKKQTKKGFLSRLIGRKDEDEPEEQAPQNASELAEANTLAPGAAPPPGIAGADPGAPWHKPPEHSGETGHVAFGPGQGPQGAARPAGGGDPFNFDGPELAPGAAERTMAPGYAGGAPGGRDPFGFDQNELTMAPGYAQPGQPPPRPAGRGGPPPGGPSPGGPSPGELTMAPGYAAPGGKADPFGASPGELTMVPGYAGGKAADPFGPAPGELTMAPGYAAPGGAPPGRPGTGRVPPAGGPSPGELTMAPGYAGGPDPFGQGPGDLTMAPGYVMGKGPGAADPFNFDAADLTMAPSYAPGRGPGPGGPGAAPPGGSMDELSFEPRGGRTPTGGMARPPSGALVRPPSGTGRVAPSPLPGAPADPFGGPAGVADPFGPGPGGAGAPVVGGEDPFGPPLLDDPFGMGLTPPTPGGAGPVPPRAPGAAGPVAAIEAGDEVLDLGPGFQGERTMVDLDHDIDQLGNLAEEPLLDLGALGPPAAAPVGVPAPPRALGAPPPPVAAAGPRALFQVMRPEGRATVWQQPAPEVVLDAARGLLFAPPVPGGWTRVPPGCAVLSDGSVVGRVAIRDGAVRLAAPSQDGALELPKGAQVDPETRAVLVPDAQRGELAWRPELAWRVADGLSFFLPAGSRHDAERGVWLLPPQPTALTGAAPDPRHGRALRRLSYLGLTEVVHEDGWARLELPPEATFDADSIQLPADARTRPGTAPALLRPRLLPDGRLELPLPTGAAPAGPGALWIPPVCPPEPAPQDDLLPEEAAARDTREYGGLRDELLADGRVRLLLPPGARVVEGELRLPGEYGLAMSAEVRLEFDRLADGTLAWRLPRGTEVIGSTVLIPPAGEEEPAPAPPRRATGRSAPAVKSEPPAEEGGGRRVKALDRFRSKGKGDEAREPEPAPAEKAPETAGKPPETAEKPPEAATSPPTGVASPFEPGAAEAGPAVASPFDPPSGEAPAAAPAEEGESEGEDDPTSEEPGSSGAPEGDDGRRGKKKKRKR